MLAMNLLRCLVSIISSANQHQHQWPIHYYLLNWFIYLVKLIHCAIAGCDAKCRRGHCYCTGCCRCNCNFWGRPRCRKIYWASLPQVQLPCQDSVKTLSNKYDVQNNDVNLLLHLKLIPHVYLFNWFMIGIIVFCPDSRHTVLSYSVST